MTNTKPRPTIAELEKILNSPDKDSRAIEISPAGDVRELTATEALSKNLRLARETNEALRREVDRLKEKLGQIAKLAGER